ncbi:hypothetical protein IEQ34_022161 [Dendrobium chrysotoxum]|uniref:Uncharacterized protein n=1 Tax=Dendrobium chrysotoxum TaxID=161865 RepID=A0AAV7FWF6_DENCH|nr:hypothetical protein IEQ34_022161 [Dendrobium chrysotoxum]
MRDPSKNWCNSFFFVKNKWGFLDKCDRLKELSSSLPMIQKMDLESRFESILDNWNDESICNLKVSKKALLVVSCKVLGWFTVRLGLKLKGLLLVKHPRILLQIWVMKILKIERHPFRILNLFKVIWSKHYLMTPTYVEEVGSNPYSSSFGLMFILSFIRRLFKLFSMGNDSLIGYNLSLYSLDEVNIRMNYLCINDE